MKENNQFMQDVNVLYLNQHRMSLTECYRTAKEAAAKRGDDWIPSLSTVRSNIKRLPKDLVKRARGDMNGKTEKTSVYWFRVDLYGSRKSSAVRASVVRSALNGMSVVADVRTFTDQELMAMIEHGICEAYAEMFKTSKKKTGTNANKQEGAKA